MAWSLDSTGTNTVPPTNNPIVPGYLLSRHFAPPPSSIPGTLFAANLLALPGVSSDGVGSATLRLNAAGTQAVLNFTLSDLSSVVTSEHIDNDPYLTSPTELIFDISPAKPQADGSYLWNIKAVGTLSAADIVEIIREGKASINIHTANNPNGELSGHFTLADGVQNFHPAAQPRPPGRMIHANSNAAARFLTQATFGASPADIAAVQSLGYDGWLSNQFNLPATHHLPVVQAGISADPTDPYPSALTFNTWWQQSVTAPDQLRQRVAFALSEIMVVSQQGVLQNHADALSSYYDTLLDNAFGNYRNLLEAVTLAPAMGNYLDMRSNDKGSMITGHPCQ